MFSSKLNTMTGRMDWVVLDEDYDYQQELARAGFADMLHDFERVRINLVKNKQDIPNILLLFLSKICAKKESIIS